MKARLVAIGNSRGIRIPKALIEQCGLERDLELRVEGRTLVLAPRSPRAGWGAAFAAAAGDTRPEVATEAWPRTRFDRGEWRW